jgi:RNA polymerase sigma-70 factor, ECF subfamily
MTNTIPDEELVESTLGGDEHAFAELYERYRQPVYSTAYRITQNVADAQDATQEIFVKLFRSLGSWNRARAKFSTWLFRLAANHAIDRWRQRRRRPEDQMPEGTAGRDPLDSTLREAMRSPYRDLENREHLAEVRRCIDNLPELQKKVFVLRYFQELKLEEIAEIEGCSLGTVKTSLFRATQTVRRAFRSSRKTL